MNEVQIVREGPDLEKLKRQWLEEEPFFGALEIKGQLKSPYAHLSFEERKNFLNDIRVEYETTIVEYLNENEETPELERKLDRLAFKIIDDTMNYLLFLIDTSQDSRKTKYHLKERNIISDKFGIRTVFDIMKKPENVCNCIYSIIRELTYNVRVPPEDIKNYYDLFSEEKKRYDHRNMWMGLIEKQSQNPDPVFPIVGVLGSGFKNNTDYWNSDTLGCLGAGSEGYPSYDELDMITGILKSIPANNGATILKYLAKPRMDDPAYA